MIVGSHRDHLLGALLADDVFVQLFLDLVGSRNIVDGEYRFGAGLFLLLDLGLLLAAEASEYISQIQKTDRRLFAPLPAALLFFFLRLVLLLRLVSGRRICFNGRCLVRRRFHPGLILSVHDRFFRVHGPGWARGERIILHKRVVLHKKGIVEKTLKIKLACLVYSLLHTLRAKLKPARQVDHFAGLLFRASAHEAEFPRSAFMIIRIVCHILSSFLLFSPCDLPISFQRGSQKD